MANSGGTNGSVKIVSSATGSDVHVTFPAQPGPPPQVEHTDIYTNAPDWLVRRAEHTMPPLRLDTSVDANGNATGAVSHA